MAATISIALNFYRKDTEELQRDLQTQEVDPGEVPFLLFGDVVFLRNGKEIMRLEDVEIPIFLITFADLLCEELDRCAPGPVGEIGPENTWVFNLYRLPGEKVVYQNCITDSCFIAGRSELKRALAVAIEETMHYIRSHFPDLAPRMKKEDAAWFNFQYWLTRLRNEPTAGSDSASP